ncbi:MAG: hypothetical protein KIS91_13125 [Anaerolineae bacterium]|nr:hypothetical protein [Anaerolineae bacterium]
MSRRAAARAPEEGRLFGRARLAALLTGRLARYRAGDVLPAVGGAVEQMVQADDEREDELMSGGGVVGRFGEVPAPRVGETNRT